MEKLNKLNVDQAPTKNLLLVGATLITSDEVIENGFVWIKDHKIEAISSKSISTPPDTLYIDATDYIITSGFINAHSHVSMNMFRDLAHQTNDMIYKLFFPWEKKLSPEIIAALSYPYILGGLLSGTTAFADHYYFSENILEAFKVFGVKAIVGETVADIGSAMPSKDKWKTIKESIENWSHDTSYFIPAVAPHATDSNSQELLSDMASFAKKNNLPLHMHLSQTQKEREFTLKNYGLTPVQFAEQCGALGKNTLAVHLVSADKEDLNIIKNSGTFFGFTPTSEIIYEKLPNLETILELQIPFLIGTDCAASHDSADMMQEMKTTHLLCQIYGKEKNLTEKILTSTTSMASKFFGVPQWSNFSVDSDADLVFWEKSLETLPIQIPRENLLFSQNQGNVKHVMIRGQWQLFHRQPVGAALDDLKQEFESALGKFKRLVAD